MFVFILYMRIHNKFFNERHFMAGELNLRFVCPL